MRSTIANRAGTLEYRRIVVVDRVLALADCQTILRDLEYSWWHSSSVVNRSSGRVRSSVQEGYRSSLTSLEEFFGKDTVRLLRRMEAKVRKWFGIAPVNLEPWQATRYSPGQRFDYHLDAGLWRRTHAGERKRTLLVYLDQACSGGNTHFRALNRWIEPSAGRLVVWNNLLPSGLPDYAMIHSGLPVEAGTKTTLVTWERERPCRKETSGEG